MLSDIGLNRKHLILVADGSRNRCADLQTMIHPFNILNYTTHHACALFDNGFALLWFCFGIIHFVINVSWQCN